MVKLLKVMYMKKIKDSKILFAQQKFIKTKELLDMGYSYYLINRMVDFGKIKKVNGTTFENLEYDGEDNDLLYASGYIDDGIVCLMSAAVYHGLSTFRPYRIDVAIRQKSKVSTLPEWPNISLYYFSEKRYSTGVKNVMIEGGVFRVYDMEKTVCDLLAYRNKFGIEDSLSVLKNYIAREDRNIDKLIDYAEKLRSKAILMKYLEVLL